MLKRLALICIILVLASVPATAFHVHGDGAAHDDCPVCVASYHQLAAGHAASALNDAPRFVEATLIPSSSVFTEKVFISFLNPRAPPA
jgi:hypothetical protein